MAADTQEKVQDMDRLVLELTLTDDKAKKEMLASDIVAIAYENGVYPSSIHELYVARGENKFPATFSVPAINLRTLTYDLAKAIFRVAKKINAGAFIFEIAKSEMAYTNQPASEYTAVCLAAAVKEGWTGPVFVQGDHFQVNPKNHKQDPAKEIDSIKALILHALEAGFYNIDIDSSTVVDLSKKTVKEQQKLNYEICAELTEYIRAHQPKGVMVSVGGEIGEVGHANSTPEELRVYMQGYLEVLKKGTVGISKVSVQTGTSHGGVVLPDGTIAKVKLDFDTLKTLSEIAKAEYGMAGAVQHGASTLPSEAFGKFPEVGTAEVHLATEFQNMVFDSPNFPAPLKAKVYDWLKNTQAAERKEGETEEQFLYKTRKKALGQFKKDIMSLPIQTRNAIAKEIEARFEFLFGKLNVANTRKLTDAYVKLTKVTTAKKGAKDIEIDGEGAD